MKITVVTSNPNKAKEVKDFFQPDVEVDYFPLECPEFRNSDVNIIAQGKAEYAYEKLHVPLIVDDTAFSVEALMGFPGPYAAYVFDTLGNSGILKLLEGIENRNASFTTAIAYIDENDVSVFSGTLYGQIGPAKGTGGFGYDPIFYPGERSLATLDLSEKNKISHRAKALSVFRDWLMKHHSIYEDNR